MELKSERKSKITFIDLIDWDYNPITPYEKALGGTQSALCHLTASLAKDGHCVYLINNTKKTSLVNLVNCIQLKNDSRYMEDVLNIIDSDVIIVLSLPTLAIQLRKIISKKHVKLYLWTQHSYDQECFKGMNSNIVKDSWDGYIFVSNWQKDAVCNYFNLDRNKAYILKNAISPAFEELFDERDEIIKIKTKDPYLIYTSTPFRGLEILLELYPDIQKELPDIKLKVISSLKTYQIESDKDEYQHLYKICARNPGIDYMGGLSQTDLSTVLKGALILTYPNTFEETSCISVMEALASGCSVVTTSLAALPETTEGFASLIEGSATSKLYKQKFIKSVVSSYRKLTECSQDSENKIRSQINFYKINYNWNLRAKELVSLLDRNK